MLCALILYVSSGTYSLTSTPKNRFLRNCFMEGLFTLKLFDRNLLRINRRNNICFHISFCCLTWDTNPGFTSNKPKHYLLDSAIAYIHHYVHNLYIMYNNHNVNRTLAKMVLVESYSYNVHAYEVRGVYFNFNFRICHCSCRTFCLDKVRLDHFTIAIRIIAYYSQYGG